MMVTPISEQVIFFGCPLDCDEKHDAIEEKRTGAIVPGYSDDPLAGVMALLVREVPPDRWQNKGSLEVPPWLKPIPVGVDRGSLAVDPFIEFMDQDGCRQAAREVDRFVTDTIYPHLPCLVAVDHSLSGGVYRALARQLGEENLTLIILDSHTDAIPMPVVAEAIQYDMDTNPQSVYDPGDPFLYNRSDSYNASSFIHHLLAEEVVDPQDLYLIGVSDYPQKKALRIKDPRITSYVGAYTGLKRRGVKLVTKKECLLKPSKLRAVLNTIRTPYVYISIDMDIGARNALEGVRFRNWQGLAEKQIYSLVNLICAAVPDGVQLAGMDVAEINPRRARGHFESGPDHTYRIAANLIKRIAFNMDEGQT